MFQVVWSSVVHVLWYYPGSVVYISPSLSFVVAGFLSLPQLMRLSPLHSFNFDFKVSIFWQFFSYFNWSVLFRGDSHINQQAAFSCLFLITISGLLAVSHNLSALAYPSRLWYCLFLLLFGAHARTIYSLLFIFISFFATGHLNYVAHIRQCAHF